jgi:uroporphyrinogen-III synthase
MSGSGPLVVVTREADAGTSLARALERHGLRTWSVPTVATALPADTADLDAAIESLPDADWLVFTSARAVAPMCGRQAWRRLWPHVSGHINVAAVGPVTASALATAGVVPRVVATGGSAELLQAMAATPPGLVGRRLVWPRSDIARQDWTMMAEAAGARVTAPVAYCTVEVPVESLHGLVAAIAAGEVHGVSFCSPSSATSLARAFADGTLRDLTGRVVVAALGRETAAALARLGATADVLASAPLAEALADGLARHLATDPGGPV